VAGAQVRAGRRAPHPAHRAGRAARRRRQRRGGRKQPARRRCARALGHRGGEAGDCVSHVRAARAVLHGVDTAVRAHKVLVRGPPRAPAPLLQPALPRCQTGARARRQKALEVFTTMRETPGVKVRAAPVPLRCAIDERCAPGRGSGGARLAWAMRRHPRTAAGSGAANPRGGPARRPTPSHTRP